MLIGLLRYAHVIEKHQNCVLNTAGLSTAWICAAGLIMVGNFQVISLRSDTGHMVTSGLEQILGQILRLHTHQADLLQDQLQCVCAHECRKEHTVR